MQALPIIIAVFLAAAAIIAVLLWRIKPQYSADIETLNRRIAEESEKARLLQAKFDASQIELRNAFGAAAAAKASAEAAQTAKSTLEENFQNLSNKFEALTVEHKAAVARAASAENQAENVHIRNGEVLAAYEIMAQERDKAKQELVEAVAKQRSDEAAAHQFEHISQVVLKEVLEDAKRGVGDLANALQKSGGDELQKHAQQVARTLEPLQAKLQAYDAAIASFQKGSQENYGSLREQLSQLQETERTLHEQAKALTTALSASPKVKGMYGEMILKQLVEFVGMREKCHFEVQALRETDEGRKIPDLVISLPGGQKVLVDSKAVMNACVEAQKAEDDVQRAIWLKKHCDNVRVRVNELSSKNYFADHQDAVEAVVLFLPAENLYVTAMENDPGLTEFAMSKNIVVCGPNSLMLLLKVANQLWRRASIEKEAQDIKDCGEKIFKAACRFVDKFAGVGKKIQSLEIEYNEAVGTLEGSLLPAGKRMSKFEAVSRNQELSELAPLKDNVRELREATKQLVVSTQKLPGLVVGEYETAELTFAAGDD